MVKRDNNTYKKHQTSREIEMSTCLCVAVKTNYSSLQDGWNTATSHLLVTLLVSYNKETPETLLWRVGECVAYRFPRYSIEYF